MLKMLKKVLYWIVYGDIKYGEFFNSVRNGNLEDVEWWVGVGADVNHKDAEGRSVLFFAVRHKRLSVMSYLLKNGADIDSVDNYGYNILDYVDYWVEDEKHDNLGSSLIYLDYFVINNILQRHQDELNKKKGV